MNHADPEQERVNSLRRSRMARRGLVLGAVAGSVGIAGALGLSTVVTQGATTSTNTTTNTPSAHASSTDGGAGQTQRSQVQGDDDGGEESDALGEESDDGGQVWVPAPPSTQFNGGQVNNGGGASAPHATSGGS